MTDEGRARAKRLLRKVPPLRRLIINMASEASRGHRLEVGMRTVGYELRTRLLGRPTVAPIGGHSRIIVYPGETNGSHACRNPPNWPEMGVWRQHLRPGDLFLDVGANIGIYTLFALDLGAEVIACEPDRHNAQRLEENLALNGFTAEVIQKAISDRPGILRFTQGLDSYNHLVLDGAPTEEISVIIEVEATTVDDLLGDRVAAGMKIDVEGAERLVLEGASRALRDRRIRLIQLEWSERVVHSTLGEGRDPAWELLAQAGYVLHKADRRTAALSPLGDSPAPRKDVFAVPDKPPAHR